MNEEPTINNEQTATEPKAEFFWEDWLLEGFRGIRLVAHDCGVPDEFWQHLHSAHKETLAASGVLLQAALRGQLGRGLFRAMRRVSGMDGSSAETSRPATRIQVE